MHAETHTNKENSKRMRGRDKRKEKRDDERIVKENDRRRRSAVLSCICPLGLLLSSEPCVLNLPLSHDPPQSWYAHTTTTHKSLHTCTNASMHAALAERARKQPENTPATRHFAKHNTHTHIMHNHTQNSPFVGSAPSCTGTRDGRKVFCQGLLLSSQKGTQSQAREQQPNSIALRQGLSVCSGHTVGMHSLGQPSVLSHC